MHEGSQKLRRLGLAVLFALAASATQALSQTNPACGVPAALSDGWNIDSPESAGLDGARLCAIAARLRETEADVHAVVIARHGKLISQAMTSPGARVAASTISTQRPSTTSDQPRRA